MEPIIQLESLSTGYRQGRSLRMVSEDLTVQMCRGELIMLMGPNGSGKSTLMQTIAGLLAPLEGRASMQGQDIASLHDRDRARCMSLVLTERIISPNLTVWDVVSIGRYPYLGMRGRLWAEDRAIIERSLGQCSLAGYEHRPLSELSDGERQRAMIARALAQETPIMLLDEPTAHLDLPSRLEIVAMLRHLARTEGKAILVSTHELDLALQWADTIWLMDHNGKLVSDSPEGLILSGDIERVFGNEQMIFDPHQGNFRIRMQGYLPVSIAGEGLRYDWTIRALARLGYEPSNGEGIPHVRVENVGWTLTRSNEYPAIRFSSMQALCRALIELRDEWKN